MAEMKKKKILVIRSFWTSDIKLDWELIKTEKNEEWKIISSFRSKTEKICQNFDAFKERISFPILDSFLEERIWKNAKVFLAWIFTNQEVGHEQDTIFLQDILKLYNQEKNRNLAFVPQQMILSEPRNLQNNLDIIAGFLKKLDENIVDDIFICPTWWTKGIVSALYLASLEQLNMKKISFFYGEEQRDNTTSFIKQDGIKSSSQKQFLATLLDHQDFDSLISYVEYNDLELFCEKEYRFAKYMISRLNCDYTTCKTISLDHALKERTRITSTLNTIEEKINGILYTRKKGRYVEFLGRVFNFTDCIVKDKVKELYKFEGENDPKLKDIWSFLDNNPWLEDFLNQRKVNWNNLSWNYEKDGLNPDEYMNKYVLHALVAFKRWMDSKCFKIIDNLTILNNYRNWTVIAHWNKDITKQIICDKYVGDIEEDFMFLLNSLCWKSDLWINKKA